MNAKAVAKNFVDADGYARQVVANVLRSTPVKRQWAGGVANLIWFTSAVFWSTAWVSMIIGIYLYYENLTGLLGFSAGTPVCHQGFEAESG